MADNTDKTNKILVSVILDRSGSMETTKAQTIEGYNHYLDELRKDTATEYTVTLTQFDLSGGAPDLTISYSDKPLADVPALTPQTYEPRGLTPLYDAIGECVRRTEPHGRGVIVVVITDGAENASREFTNESVKALIKQKESEGWTWCFLGANIDAYAVGGSIGVAATNTANYAQGHEQTMYSNLASATVRRAALYHTAGRSAAVACSMFSAEERSAIENPIVTTTTTTTTKGGQPRVNTPKDQKPAGGKPRAWNANRA